MKKLLSLCLALLMLIGCLPFAAAEDAPAAFAPTLLNALTLDVAAHTATPEDMAFCAAAAVVDMGLMQMNDAFAFVLSALETGEAYMLVHEDGASLQVSFYDEGAQLDFLYTPAEQTALAVMTAWDHSVTEAESAVSALIVPGGFASYTKLDNELTTYCVLGILETLQSEADATAAAAAE